MNFATLQEIFGLPPLDGEERTFTLSRSRGDNASVGALYALDGEDESFGDFSDAVIGWVEIALGDNGTLAAAAGIFDSNYEMGDGVNYVLGLVTVSAGDDLLFLSPVHGIEASNLTGGAQTDWVVGVVNISVEAGGLGLQETPAGHGIGATVIDTGGGDDRVIGITLAQGGEAQDTFGLAGIAGGDIDTGDGDDIVAGVVAATVGNDGIVSSAGLLRTDTVNTGADNDLIIGAAFAAGGTGADLDVDGIFDTRIMAGDGDDIVIGISVITGTGLSSAYGTGIENLDRIDYIRTGQGADIVIGLGADVAIDGTSYGIDGVGDITLGSENDFVFARGATAGVNNVNILGEEGNDVFDLHSGTGAVNGGIGERDMLILTGNMTDYTRLRESSDEGNLSLGVTDLDVEEIEFFQFDDGIFTFDQVFPETVS